MKTWIILRRVAGAIGALMAVNAAQAAEESLVTAVFAKTHNGYERAKDADGTFSRETYTVAKGSYEPGLGRDPSIENVKFAGVVRALAPYLARQNYVPAVERTAADLLLVLHWGTTIPFNTGISREFVNVAADAMRTVQFQKFGSFMDMDASQVTADAEGELEQAMMMLNMANRMRDQANQHNANLLGYIHEVNKRNTIARYAGAGVAYDELIEDIEEERYYVIIGAYDMQALLEGQHRLLWSTRVSIRSQGNRFDQWLPTMFANASKYFGEASDGLVRRFQRATRVDMGELKSLGVVEDPAAAAN